MLEQRGVPTAVMGTFEFEQLARLEAKNRGIADLPLALIPHPLGGIHEDEVVRKADLALEVGPEGGDAAHERRAGPAATTLRLPRRLRRRSTRHYQERGWTDGLPIVPPTEARVREFLRCTDRDPREVVGVLPPRQGEATVEKHRGQRGHGRAAGRSTSRSSSPPSRRWPIRCSISTPSRPPRIRWRR